MCILHWENGFGQRTFQAFPRAATARYSSKDDDMPVASAFDHGFRRCRVPTVHSKVGSTENSEEPFVTIQFRFGFLVVV